MDESGDEYLMMVRRGHVLEDALRSMERNLFSPKLPLNVSNITNIMHSCYPVPYTGGVSWGGDRGWGRAQKRILGINI